MLANIISIMSASNESLLVKAVVQLLHPLLRILLRNGIASSVVEEAVRKVYVDEAFLQAAHGKKKATTSAVAAMTGLSRKEVARLRDQQGDEGISLRKRYNRAVRVISGWLNDSAYLDHEGRPKTITNEGPKPSFDELCKTYSGSMTTRAMLDLLLRANCIHYQDGNVRLIKHSYVPANDSAELIHILGTDTRELIETIDHNMVSVPDKKRFQRKVSYDNLPHEVVERIKTLSAIRSQALLEELNHWLSQHQHENSDSDERYSVSIGIYYHERKSSQEHD